MEIILEVYYDGDYKDLLPLPIDDNFALPFYNIIDGIMVINYLQLYSDSSCIATNTPPYGKYIPEIILCPLRDFPVNTIIRIGALSIICDNDTMMVEYTYQDDTWSRIISPAIIIDSDDDEDDYPTENGNNDPAE